MKGAICVLVASSLLTTAGSGEAWAQKTRRVVVEQFGSGAERLRSAVLKALARQGVEVIPNKKVAVTEANLGLLSVSDNYAAVATELKVTAFISGSVGGGKKRITAKVRVRDAGGQPLGVESWSGRSAAKAISEAEEGLAKWLGTILGAKALDAAAAAEEAAQAAPQKKEPRALRSRSDNQKATFASKARRNPEDATASVSVAGGSSESGLLGGLDAALGVHVYQRNFTYSHSILGGQQEYKLDAVPALNLGLEYFFGQHIGVGLGGEYSMGLFSREMRGAALSTYHTSSYAFFAELKGRHTLGSVELKGGVGYGKHAFEVIPEANDPSPPQVAGVNYSQLRAGGAVRIGVSDTFAIFAGGTYLHLLSMGELKSPKYFKDATGRGAEGFAGVAYAFSWAAGLEARVAVDLRRYVFDFHTNPARVMDYTRIAGGATDQYMGATLVFGYRPR